MCGRMTLTRSGSEIADYFSEAMQTIVTQAEGRGDSSGGVLEADGRPLRPRFNLAPTQDVLTVVPGAAGSGAGAEFAWKRWGLVPAWAKDPNRGAPLFNARSESVALKPSFRSAFKRRRCLVVADGFYEWTPRNRDHQPFYFRPAGGGLMAFAGLYEAWHGEGGEVVESCTVLTTEASEDLAGVHHRMPVILKSVDYSAWLDLATGAEILDALMAPLPLGFLDRRAVSRRVGNPRNDDAACIAPATEDGGAEEPGQDELDPQVELFSPESKKPGEA